MKPIRVASLNLHGALPRCREGLAHLLAAQDADLLCLQECPASFPPELIELLGAPWRQQWAPAAFLGNALLTRLPVRSTAALVLEGGFSEARSAAIAVVDGPRGPLPVCCTHLDHRDAPARLEQWADLLSQRPDLDGGLIVGDLNALTRSDYSDAVWEEIDRQRSVSLWEPAGSELMDAAAARGFRDAAEGFALSGTCRFDTRIDYVLLGPGCPLSVEDYDTVSAGGLTDHSLVAAALAAG